MLNLTVDVCAEKIRDAIDYVMIDDGGIVRDSVSTPVAEQLAVSVHDLVLATRQIINMYLSNVNVPLEARWELFEEYGDILVNSGYREPSEFSSWIEEKGFTYYDTFGKERGSYISFLDVVRRLRGHKSVTEQEITFLKEMILGFGVTGFVYDW